MIDKDLLMDDKVALMPFSIVYDVQYIRGKRPPSLLALLLFGIIWKSEDQNNEFDDQERKNPYNTI